MYEDTEGQVVDEKTSKYNSAIDQLKRINNLWQKVNLAAETADFLKWNMVLDRIWCELGGDLGDSTDDKKTIASFQAFNDKIVKLYPLNSGGSKSFNPPNEIQQNKKALQYQTLLEKELFLRKLQNLQGKGTAYSDGEEDDFE